MLYQEERNDGHHAYTSYQTLEEVPGLSHLKARKMSSRDDGAKIVFGITLYESPYMACGLTEATKDQFHEWCEARNASCLREASFDDLGDELFIDAVPRRYSDEGLRLVDEQRLMCMVEDDFIELALQKHR